MKKYFLIIGIIELMSVFIGSIYFIYAIVVEIKHIQNINEIIKLMVLFILYIIFAPGLGLLFISHSKSLPEKDILYEDESQQYNNVFVKYKKTNETFIVGDTVECIDINLLNRYGVNLEGKVVYVYDDNIGVEFYNDKGHYTLSLSANQIKKL